MDNADFDLLRFLRQLWSYIKRLLCFLPKFLAVTFVFEFIFYKIHFDLFDFIKANTAISFAGAAGTIIAPLLDIYIREEHERKRKEGGQRVIRSKTSQGTGQEETAGGEEQLSQEEETAGGEQLSQEKETAETRANAFLESAYHAVARSGLCCLIGLWCLWGLMPACAAHFQPGLSLINQVAQYVEDSRQSTQQSAPQPPTPTPKLPDNAPDTQTEPQSQDTEPELLAKSNFLENPMRYIELTTADYNQVYFMTSEWEIEDWTDEDAVISAVTKFVRDLRAKKLPNKFDVEASPTMQADVSNADTDYDAMTSSTQLDKTINIHLEAWDHPKYGLAWLLTNEYQEYGDHYNEEKGHFKTVEYYYGQSIIWAEEALKFASPTDDQIKTLLSYISYRYNDIAQYAEAGSTVKQHATVLSNAFASIQNLGF